MNRIAIGLLKALSPVFFFVSSTLAQKGYIYVHVSALNEESSPDFQFTMNGGPTIIPDFYLNDQPFVPGRIYDIGTSHGITANGLGDGELWASLEASGEIYHRIAGSSQWTATGFTGTSLDGAGPGQFVDVDANGNAYFFDGSNQQVIYTAAAHGGLKATDITYGEGRIAIVTDDGSIWKNDGVSAPYTDAWTILAPTGTGASRLDMLPSSGQIVYYCTSGTVFTLPFTGGIATNIGSPGTTDVAVDDDGTIYANGNKWGGGLTWIPDATAYTFFNHMTAGPAGQAWCTSAASNAAGTIYTRTPQSIWIDDERPRLPYKGNAVILPVDAGSYTLSAVTPVGWSLESITLYDPTNNSTVAVSTAQSTINVAAGEVVHVIARGALLTPIAISQACGVISTEDFGTASTAPVVTTSYHYQNNNNIGDGYYAIATADNAGTLTDHTTGTGNMMLVNGAAQKEAFYRKRLTNLLPGQPYKLNFWIANINPTAPVKPEILAGLTGTDGVVISSFSTGAVTSSSWTAYTFTFNAPGNTADIFLQNNANGSNGNDLALDDISIIPMAGVLPSSTLTPATPGICAGTSCTIANSTPGGVWTTNNPIAATVDATGKIIAVSEGYADITYTVTDATGCLATAITTMTIYARPTVTATVGSNSICTGDSVTLSATAANTLPPYIYQWSSSPATGGAITDDKAQNTTAAPSIAGSSFTYIVAAIDGRGCTSSAATDVVTINTPPVATITYPADLCAAGIAVVARTGTTGGTYSGTAGLSIDATTGTIDLQKSTAGAHTITYTFNDGQCTGTATADINIHGLPLIAAITGGPVVCEGQKITLNNTTAAGAWSSDNITIATIDATGTVSGISAGTAVVTYTVTDNYGCTNTTDINITVNALPKATIAYGRAVYCFTGTADVIQAGTTGGTFSAGAGLAIDAQTGRLDLSASSPGMYTVNYTFTNGACANSATTTVTIEGKPVVAPITGNNMICVDSHGTTLSSATIGGTWSSSDNNVLVVDAMGHATGTGPGTAIVIYEITSASGCTNKTDFTMVVPPLPTFTAVTTPATCSYGSDGSIVVQAPGNGYKYALMEAGDWKTENTFSNLAAGDYNVQVMDEKGCISAPEIVTVTAPAPIGLIVTPKDITCHGENSGSLSLNAVGGTPPYRIAWSTGASSIKITNLPAGDYSVTVTDKNGCTSSINVKLTELFPVFLVDDPVKQDGGLLTIAGKAMPRADILVTYPDGSFTTTHTDGKGNFSTLSPAVVGTGIITITVTDPFTKGTCTKSIKYNNSTVADLSIIKSITIADAPTIGDEATFTITVNNKGLDHATQVIVTDDISNMLEDVVNITTTGGNTTFNTRTRQVVWNIDTVYVNKPLQLSFTTRITRGGWLENTAIVSGQEPDPDQDNNTASIKPVEVSPDLYIPNVVTANGDGKNDYFMVRGIEQYPGSVLEIYNRWGNQVYYSGNYSNNWGGAGLSAGIYYYVLKINMSRTVKVYKGYIELIQK
ncbi:T9SS type B sorting domain-containing protein [Chitinophaga filiformis]|uniref:Gliding motility-associated C-terminal domain-containing protein n=1 Tax=Chitinophaga filiformis TaxID=104663 RepID=A0A1G8B2B3_CHIFI|nr:gliding motility-associated C-terminal domain-containing protein [Chitinophaga filiformis]SDH27271.1 gliding motility-associated C-terminal domain-containing protein [Chitinophaga filiformis]